MKIKVISLNMWWGGELFDKVVEFLQTESPDIVLLQEVQNARDDSLASKYRSMDALEESLKYPYSNFAQAYWVNLPPGRVPHGNAVLSRYPIKQASMRYFEAPDREVYDDVPEQWPHFPRQIQHCVLETPAGDVHVFNIHGVWDLDGDSFSPARQNMSRIILEETADQPRVILGGDSNAKVSNQAMRNLEQQLTNAFVPDLTSTFNMRRKDNPGYATAPVDVLYVGRDIKVLSAECPDVDISDHLPLVVTLEM